MLPYFEAAPDLMIFGGGGRSSGHQRPGSWTTPTVHRNKKLRRVARVQHPTYTQRHDHNANAPLHVVLDYDDDSAPPPGSGSGGGGPAGTGGGGGDTGHNESAVNVRKIEQATVAVGGVDDLAAMKDGDNDVAPPQSHPAQDHPTHMMISVNDDGDSNDNVATEGGVGGMATRNTGSGGAGRIKRVCSNGERVAVVATVFSDIRPTQAPKAEDDVDDSTDSVKNGGGGGGKAGIGEDGSNRGANGRNLACIRVTGGAVGERDGMILPCGVDDVVAEVVPDLTEDGPKYIVVDEYDDDSMGSIPSGSGGGVSAGVGTGGGGTGTNSRKSKATTNESMVTPVMSCVVWLRQTRAAIALLFDRAGHGGTDDALSL